MSIKTNQIHKTMSKINATFKSLSFLYDFAVDGGAVGAIGLGIFLPVGYIPISMTIVPVTNFTSGGLAVISLGTVGNPTLAFSADAYTAVNIGTYTLLTSIVPVPAMSINNPSEEMILTIGVAALTGGALKGTIFFMEY